MVRELGGDGEDEIGDAKTRLLMPPPCRYGPTVKTITSLKLAPSTWKA